MEHPVAQLMDDLKSEDVKARVEATSRLHTIALALGPERARTELIPFCEKSLLREDDEVLTSLIHQLNNEFVELIGGPQHFPLLVPLYEALLTCEESNVRSDCVVAVKGVISDENRAKIFFPMFERLAKMVDWFSHKSAAAAISPLLYPYLNEKEKAQVRDTFRDALVCSYNPIVRRAALVACKSIFPVSDGSEDWSEWLNIIASLLDDPQDSVRLLLVEPVALIGQRMSHNHQIQKIYPLVMRLIGENSWRVRYMCALSYADLMKAVGMSVPDFQPLLAFANLLTDYEAEVRVAASGQIAAVASLWPVPETFSAGLLPVLQKIVLDPNPAVRAALALQLNELSQVAGRDATMKDLLPLFLQLFQDESPQVRLNVIAKLDVINKVIGVEHLSQALVPAIVRLTEDKLWTVRQAIIGYIPTVSEHLGVGFFDSQLRSISINLLDDPVYAVRQSALKMLVEIGSVFGVDHFAQSILPNLERLAAHQNYLRRITYLMALAESAALVSQIDSALWLPSLQRLSSDTISNVRMNAAKAAKLLPHTASILESLAKDSDDDVLYFAR